MKGYTMRKLTYTLGGVALTLTAVFIWAQDPVKVDSKHYKV